MIILYIYIYIEYLMKFYIFIYNDQMKINSESLTSSFQPSTMDVLLIIGPLQNIYARHDKIRSIKSLTAFQIRV